MRGWLLAFGGSLLGLGAFAACGGYVEGGGPPDAGGEPPGAEAGGSSSGASSSSSSSGAPGGFVPEQAPAWQPTFEADAGGAFEVNVSTDCPDINPRGGPLSGSYAYTGGCFSAEKFANAFSGYCPGIRIAGFNAKARVAGTVEISSDQLTATRYGTLWASAEVLAPCRRSLIDGADDGDPNYDYCTDLAALVVAGINTTGSSRGQLSCWDTSIDECTCHLQMVDDISNDELAIDSEAGTLAVDEFYYGLTSSPTQLRYVGIPVPPGTFKLNIDPAMSWVLTPL